MAAITSMFISIDNSGKILVHVPKASSIDKKCFENARRVSILRNHVVERGSENELLTKKCDNDANKNYSPLSGTKLLYTCIVGDCQNNFVSEVDLKKHQAMQHAITQYHSSNVRVEKTVEDAVPISDSDRRLIARIKKENAAKLACEMCGQMTRKDWMARHLTNVHGVQVNSGVKTLRSFPKVKCPKCEKMLSTSILHRHMVAVHKIRSEKLTMVSCHLCSKEMTSSKLWSHVKFGCQERKSKDPAYCENVQKRPKAVVKAVINLEKELAESKEWMRKFREMLDLTRVRIDKVRREAGEPKFEFAVTEEARRGTSIHDVDEDTSLIDSIDSELTDERIGEDLDEDTSLIDGIDSELKDDRNGEDLETENVDSATVNLDEIPDLKEKPNNGEDCSHFGGEGDLEKNEPTSGDNTFIEEEIIQSLVLEASENIKSLNNERDAIFSCPKCSYASPAKSNMSRHISRVHNTEKPFECTYCGKFFVNIKSQERHKRKIHKIKASKEVCDICCKRFKTGAALCSHKAVCTDIHQTKFSLLLRNRHSMSKEELRRAKMEYHSQCLKNGPLTASGNLRKFSGLTEPISISKSTKQAIGKRRNELGLKMACDVCGIQVRKDWMKRHMINVHRIGTQRKQVHVYPKVECPNCAKKVSTVGLARHMSKIHQLRGALELLVSCHVCGEQVQCTTMDYHVRTNCGSSKHTKKNENDSKNE